MSSTANSSPSFRQQAPAALSTSSLIDSDYDYSAVVTGSNTETGAGIGGNNNNNNNSSSATNSSMKSPTAVTSNSNNAYSNIRTTPTSAAAHYTAAALRAAKEKAAQNLHKLHIDNLDQDDYYDDDDDYGDEQDDLAADGEEALLDLVQLEELHQEAERMKALGNKHMAAQGAFFYISMLFWNCVVSSIFLMVCFLFFNRRKNAS
jgi:hypothetical protein